MAGLAAVQNVGFSKTWLMTYASPWTFHNCTKFGAKILIDAQIMAQNRNSRWRYSAILEFLYHHIWPNTKSLHCATPYSLSNFMLIRYIVLKIYCGFDFFAELTWNAYYTHKLSVFGVWMTLKRIIVETPKRHICTRKHVLWALIHSIRSIFMTCRQDERICLFVCLFVCLCKRKKN